MSTSSSVDFVPSPTADALLRDVPLDFTADLPVLGIATRFETNSAYVAGVIEEAFGRWRSVAAVENGSLVGVRVRIVVHAGSESPAGHTPVRHICPDTTRVIAHSPGSVGVSDPERRESVMYITTALAEDRANFREAMLEALTLSLLSHFDRHPIHAAAVARDGHAVLLAGPSGSGKSTLAFVAHTAGLDVLSDDRVWVQLTPTFRVWGWPGRVRLLSDAVPRISNTQKVVIDLPQAIEPSGYMAERATVCALVRGGSHASLDRLSPERIADVLRRKPDPGFDRFPERHDAVVAALAEHGGWQLTLSDDPREALPLLTTLLASPS
jgi:hypothetical protein